MSTMALQKLLYIFETEHKKHLVFVDDFYKYLKEQAIGTPRCYIVRLLKNVVIIDDKEAVTVTEILRYCFNYQNVHTACEKVVNLVLKEVLYGKNKEGSTNEYVRTTLELYRLIAKSELVSVCLTSEQAVLDNTAVNTLVPEHEGSFSVEEWRTIKRFEHHFAKEVKEFLPYEEMLKLKWKKFEMLSSFMTCSKVAKQIVKNHVRHRLLRHEAAKQFQKVHINGSKIHISKVLDTQLYALVQENVPDSFGNVTVIQEDMEQKVNSVVAIIEVKFNEDTETLNNLSWMLMHELDKRHTLVLTKVFFLPKDVIDLYRNKDGCVTRFLLFDDLNMGNITDVIFKWENKEGSDNQNLMDKSVCENGPECTECFSQSLPKPLLRHDFNIIQEWNLDVPLELQIFLEVFVNKDSLKRTHCQTQFLQQKLQKLYIAFDSLLNIFNKNFIGLFQLVNTDELLQDCKNLKTVFSITSSSGATTSLEKAEADWKARAENDMLYYNAYLKPHTIMYETEAGMESKDVSLRQCHIILMLDNLVRIKSLKNANRGENETGQLDTLPLTIQGLPLDAAETAKWHDPNFCDATAFCQCKNRHALNKEDITMVLFEPSPTEKSTYNQFINLCSWGFKEIWHGMTDEITQLLEDQTHGTLVTQDDTESERLLELESDQPHESTDDDEDDMGGIEINSILAAVDTVHLEEELLEENVCVSSDSFSVGTFIEDNMPMETSVDSNIPELEESFLNLSIVEETERTGKDIVGSFGFSKFKVPPLLCRHPPPATGKDSDVSNIKRILDDVLVKLGYIANKTKCVNRILCGPDNKIGNCLLKLMSINEKYNCFLPEFPLLHLRKSMITIMFSSYKDAGLVHLLKYMRDDNRTEWSRLISTHHIDAATRNVRRIGQALHLAFLVTFANYLPATESEIFLSDMSTLSPQDIAQKWSVRLAQFMTEGSDRNATFALHRDMMKHCDDIVAVSFAERLGGQQGYQLLLSAVKSSLPFSFVNGASSYGPYCVQLLYQHYSAGHFHKSLKEALFTTPIGSSTKNFACDTKREMDHLEALKGFRSGSTINSVTCKMSLIDTLNEGSRVRLESSAEVDDDDNLGWTLTEVDLNHIYPTASLILRRNGLSLTEQTIPFNVYARQPTALPPAMLDTNSQQVAEFLIKKYCMKEKLFNGLDYDDLKNQDILGPNELVQRAKKAKGTTLKRILKSKINVIKTVKEENEVKRKKLVARKTKKIDCLTSEVNACQALLKPDASKPKVFKSLGMQKAIKDQVSSCISSRSITKSAHDSHVEKYLLLNLPEVPSEVSSHVTFATVEFAGVKFKATHCTSGRHYILFVEAFIKNTLRAFPFISDMVICEEKYSYTPDNFKSATRSQRQTKSISSVSHLKPASSILSETAFDKDALTKTPEGKALISRYLAENIEQLSLSKNLCLTIDSEFSLECCGCPSACVCSLAAVPIQKIFQEHGSTTKISKLSGIKQCKGEAEMSQVDWLVQQASEIPPGKAAVSIVTSGDIDAVYIHLFTLSRLWPRNEDGKFLSTVYVVLQKIGPRYDIYNITKILELFEETYNDQHIGLKVAVGLCIGGNDFVPKFQQISHTTVMKLWLKQIYRSSAILVSDENIILSQDKFVEFIKELYCPKRISPDDLSFEQVRAITIGKKSADAPSGYVVRDPKRWLPPETAIRRLAEVVQLQIDYLLTAGFHDKELPNFLSKSCFKDRDGEVEFDLGEDAHFVSIASLPVVTTYSSNSKRSNEETPQQGARRKRPLTSTPVK